MSDIVIPRRPVRLRPSAIGAVLNCPLQSLLMNEGLSQPSITATMGTIGHFVLKCHKDSKATCSAVDTFNTVYDAAVRRDVLEDGYDAYHALDDMVRMQKKHELKMKLRGYDGWVGKDVPAVMTEREVSADFDRIPLVGHVDLIDVDHVLTDYKFSGVKENNPLTPQYHIQMGGYLYLCDEMHKADNDFPLISGVNLLTLVPNSHKVTYWPLTDGNRKELVEKFSDACRKLIAFYDDFNAAPGDYLYSRNGFYTPKSEPLVKNCIGQKCFCYKNCCDLKNKCNAAMLNK